MSANHAQTLATWLMAALLLMCSGCGGQVPPEVVDREFAELHGLKTTHSKGLQEEYARLLSEQATPLQMIPPAVKTPEAAATIASYNNLFKPGITDSLLEDAQKLHPFERGQSPRQLELQQKFRMKWDGQRRKALAAWRGVHPPVYLDLAEGILAPAAPVNVTQIAVMLEACHIRERLNQGELQPAVDGWIAMMHGIELLAAQPHVTCRMVAAGLRENCLNMLPELAEHPGSGPTIRRKLEAVLEGQLQNWPPDARAWTGDRALGLHLYEMVRDGDILSVMTAKEIAALKKSKQLTPVIKAIDSNIDDDEFFYLLQMRRMIKACRQPFYQRLPELQQIADAAKRHRVLPSERYVAAHILLVQIVSAHRQQAEDRARCELHRLKLRARRGAGPLPGMVSPVDGKPLTAGAPAGT